MATHLSIYTHISVSLKWVSLLFFAGISLLTWQFTQFTIRVTNGDTFWIRNFFVHSTWTRWLFYYTKDKNLSSLQTERRWRWSSEKIPSLTHSLTCRLLCCFCYTNSSLWNWFRKLITTRRFFCNLDYFGGWVWGQGFNLRKRFKGAIFEV